MNSDADVYKATLTSSITYQAQSFLPYVEFYVTVIDPCLTTVITPFTISTITQEAGQTINTDFDEPSESAGDAVGDHSICGPLRYEVIYQTGETQTLITIEELTPNV